MSYLAIQGLCICSIPDNGGEAVQAYSTAVQFCDPLLALRLPAVAGAALNGAVIHMARADPLLPEGIVIIADHTSLHGMAQHGTARHTRHSMAPHGTA